MTRDHRIRLAYTGLHPARLRDLIEQYGSPALLVDAITHGEVRLSEGAKRRVAVPSSDRLAGLDGAGVRILLRGDLGYPVHLGELPDAPDVLFCRGSLPPELGVALVGTRAATRYGILLARAMGRAVAAAGWPVVSGLARGVDGAAHEGMLEAGGRGVAVLGSGADVWYPAEHRGLGERVLAAGGAIVSEYPPGTPPAGWRFPPRNRIISGLSGVVVIIEARVDGGALITARRALEQGRDVFVVPGDVDRSTSEGCNLLIRDGAHPVLGPDDLVEAAERVLGPATRRAATPAREVTPLLRILGPAGRHPDDLADDLGWDVAKVLVELARLEAAGRVVMEGGLAAVR